MAQDGKLVQSSSREGCEGNVTERSDKSKTENTRSIGDQTVGDGADGGFSEFEPSNIRLAVVTSLLGSQEPRRPRELSH
jgi:hypothetical protein